MYYLYSITKTQTLTPTAMNAFTDLYKLYRNENLAHEEALARTAARIRTEINRAYGTDLVMVYDNELDSSLLMKGSERDCYKLAYKMAKSARYKNNDSRVYEYNGAYFVDISDYFVTPAV